MPPERPQGPLEQQRHINEVMELGLAAGSVCSSSLQREICFCLQELPWEWPGMLGAWSLLLLSSRACVALPTQKIAF